MGMGNRYNLCSYEVNTVLDFFMYVLPIEHRGRLMQEFPEIYNKLVGRVIVSSQKIEKTMSINCPDCLSEVEVGIENNGMSLGYCQLCDIEWVRKGVGVGWEDRRTVSWGHPNWANRIRLEKKRG